jgi:hypothetical protein
MLEEQLSLVTSSNPAQWRLPLWSRISRLQNRVLSLTRRASNTSKTYYAKTTLFLHASSVKFSMRE